MLRGSAQGSFHSEHPSGHFTHVLLGDADILTEALPGDQYVAIDGKKTYFDIGPTSGGETNVRSCGQSYKHLTLVNYDSRLVITSELIILTTLES